MGKDTARTPRQKRAGSSSHKHHLPTVPLRFKDTSTEEERRKRVVSKGKTQLQGAGHTHHKEGEGHVGLRARGPEHSGWAGCGPEVVTAAAALSWPARSQHHSSQDEGKLIPEAICIRREGVHPADEGRPEA